MATRKTGKSPRKSARKTSTSGQQDADATGPEKKSTKELPQSNPERKPFLPENLDRTIIAIPLLKDLEAEQDKLKENPEQPPKVYAVVIDLNLEFHQGRDEARKWIAEKINEILQGTDNNKDAPAQFINEERGRLSQQYLFAKLSGKVIRELVRRDAAEHSQQEPGRSGSPRAIYHIWPDFKVRALINRSVSTVKADAARSSFAAMGEGIVWAVMDSGIDLSHPHFKLHRNVEVESPLEHMDFTGEGKPKEDLNGHGTHVAGIIGGELIATEMDGAGKGKSKGKKKTKETGIRAFVRNRDEHGQITYDPLNLKMISGMAPKCKLLSLRVLDENGEGDVSSLIAAIAKIQEINGYGRRLLIHGVNISVGNDFEPEWFACGQSPLCVEVNRLVSSGVVVVVAAGNSGYGSLQSSYTGVISAGMALTINDPGNADLAITVGSTHRDMPHVYGVSYFSSKGPTGDGRSKPDLVAPGEKILSCAAGAARQRVKNEAGDCDYVEDSGTSMAAPHVSGVIAAFLSVRREFIGQPEKVKEIFLSTATDLKRERYFQGYGLVDLMRAIQSV